MLEELKRNLKTILNLFVLIFSVFFGLFFIVILLANQLNFIAALYLLIASCSFSLFAAIFTFFLYYIAVRKEKKFFLRDPYNYIEKNLITYRYDKKGSFDFYKKGYVFIIDDIKFTAYYYTNSFTTEFGNCLMILKHMSEGNDVMHFIDYKNQKFSETKFIQELKNIKPDESRIVLRDI